MFALKRVSLDKESSNKIPPVNEVKLLEQLEHPNIIKYHKSFIHKKRLCILMDYADNGSNIIN